MRHLTKKDKREIRKRVRFIVIRKIAERLMDDEPITDSTLVLLKECLYNLTMWDRNTLKYVTDTERDKNVLTLKFKHYDSDYTFLVDTSDYETYNDLNICIFYRYDDYIGIRLI